MSGNHDDDQEHDDPVLQWVTFVLKDEVYGINVMQVKEVLRYSEIAPVPGSPGYVMGIINLRGSVVTIVDMRERLGLPRCEPTEQTRIIVIEVDQHVVGVMVDAVAEVVYLRESEIETTANIANEESARFIQGVCHKDKDLLILIDLEKMLSVEQWEEVEEF